MTLEEKKKQLQAERERLEQLRKQEEADDAQREKERQEQKAKRENERASRKQKTLSKIENMFRVPFPRRLNAFNVVGRLGSFSQVESKSGNEQPSSFEMPNTSSYAFITVTLSSTFLAASTSATSLIEELNRKNTTTCSVGVTREATVKTLISTLCAMCNIDISFMSWRIELEASGELPRELKEDERPYILFRAYPSSAPTFQIGVRLSAQDSQATDRKFLATEQNAVSSNQAADSSDMQSLRSRGRSYSLSKMEPSAKSTGSGLGSYTYKEISGSRAVMNLDEMMDNLSAVPASMISTDEYDKTAGADGASHASQFHTENTTKKLNEVLMTALRDIQKQITNAQDVLLLAVQNAAVSSQKNDQSSGAENVTGISIADVRRLEASLKAIQKRIMAAAVKHTELTRRDAQTSSHTSSDALQCPSIILCDGFKAEISGNEKLESENCYVEDDEPIEHVINMKTPYKDDFYGKDLLNFLGVDGPTGSPVCLTLRKDSSQRLATGCDIYYAMFWTKEETFRTTYAHKVNDKSSKPEQIAALILKQIEPSLQRAFTLTSFAPELVVPKSALTRSTSSALLSGVSVPGPTNYSSLNLKYIEDASVNKELSDRLLRIEVDQKEPYYKFGVLYGRQGQTSEEEMFANTETSPAFEEFLKLLGDRIQLKGWQKFRGGLDNKNDTCGKESVYRSFRNIEVMFHVSTLLPYEMDSGKVDSNATPGQQQLSRKRHIGNDMCLIVFLDGDTPFAADTVTSQYCQVFAVVRSILKNHSAAKELSGLDSELDANTVVGYSVAFVFKDEVPIAGPPLTSTNYSKNSAFFELLICKLINAQNTAYQAPIFAQKFVRTRTMLLKDLISTYASAVVNGVKSANTSRNSSFVYNVGETTPVETKSVMGTLRKALSISNVKKDQQMAQSASIKDTPGREVSISSASLANNSSAEKDEKANRRKSFFNFAK